MARKPARRRHRPRRQPSRTQPRSRLWPVVLVGAIAAPAAWLAASHAGDLPALRPQPIMAAADQAGPRKSTDRLPGEFPCTVSGITDGDTFRCRETDGAGREIRIRLSGVAAREADGSCSPGHPCPSATADAATAALRRLAAGRRLSCRQVGSTYGRVAAFCTREDDRDLSCAMVASGTVARWERYWGSHSCD